MAAPVLKERNTIGIIGLVCAILGLILACVPGIMLLGWILLPVGFVLGVVGLFPLNKKKGTAIGAVITSIVGFIVAAVAFTMVVDNAFDEAYNKETTITNNGAEGGTVPPGAPTEDAGSVADREGAGDGTTRENPMPIGSTISSDEWDVTVNSVDRNATEAIMAENQFNEQPAPGQTYVMANVTVTYTGSDPQGATPFVDIEFIAPDGTTIERYDATVVEPEQFDESTTLYEGASHTGNIAFLVDEAAADKGVLAVAPDMFSQKRFAALHEVEEGASAYQRAPLPQARPPLHH